MIDDRIFLTEILTTWQWDRFETDCGIIVVWWQDVECVVFFNGGNPHVYVGERPRGWDEPHYGLGQQGPFNVTSCRVFGPRRFDFIYARNATHSDFQRTLNRDIAKVQRVVTLKKEGGRPREGTG